VLNGLQLGVLLFLMAAGLTLVFGILNFINLAHGSLYMIGAYFAELTFGKTDSFSLPVRAKPIPHRRSVCEG
jgi:branched-chain amino acid transport system permease protein